MISERRLAKSFNSLWRYMTPTMELFVKRCNLDLYQRNFEPLNSTVLAERRALVNVVGYEVFHLLLRKHSALEPFKRASADTLAGVEADLRDDVLIDAAIEAVGASQSEVRPEERTEAAELARRMWVHFRYPDRRRVSTKPLCQGCGLLMSCVGDAFCEPSTITEMKDGDRPFRAYEFRQLALYAALYFNEKGTPPTNLEMVNSRRGTSVLVSTEDFASQVAGEA